jgi:hypothetical protein
MLPLPCQTIYSTIPGRKLGLKPPWAKFLLKIGVGRARREDMELEQRHKELGDAISKTKADASNIDLSYDDEKRVKRHLKQASQHHAAAGKMPGREEEHIQAGFDHVGRARELLGNNPVQSKSNRRHQFPFLPPGTE